MHPKNSIPDGQFQEKSTSTQSGGNGKHSANAYIKPIQSQRIPYPFHALPQELVQAGELSFGAICLLAVLLNKTNQGSRPYTKSNKVLGGLIGRGLDTVNYYLVELLKAGLAECDIGQRGKHRGPIKVLWTPESSSQTSDERSSQTSDELIAKLPMTHRKVAEPHAGGHKNHQKKKKVSQLSSSSSEEQSSVDRTPSRSGLPGVRSPEGENPETRPLTPFAQSNPEPPQEPTIAAPPVNPPIDDCEAPRPSFWERFEAQRMAKLEEKAAAGRAKFVELFERDEKAMRKQLGWTFMLTVRSIWSNEPQPLGLPAPYCEETR